MADSASGGDAFWAYSHVFSTAIVTVLDRVLGAFDPQPTRWIEFGCGSGPLTVQLAARGFHVTAVDADPEAIDLLEKNANRCGVLDRITLECHDVLTTEFAKHDAAISAFGVTEMADPVLAINQLVDSVVPSGLIVIGGWSSTPHTRAFMEQNCDIDDFLPTPVLGVDNIAALLKAQNLQIVHKVEVNVQTDMTTLISEHFATFMERLDEPLPDAIRRMSASNQQKLFLEIYNPETTKEDLAVTVAIVVARKTLFNRCN